MITSTLFLGLDQVEVHVETVRERQCRAVADIGLDFVLVDVGLQFVGDEHHDDVGPFGGVGDVDITLRPSPCAFLAGAGALAQRDDDVFHAAIAHVERMSMALAAVADDGHLLALDQVQVGVAIVIDTHDDPLNYPEKSALLLGRPDTADKARMPLKFERQVTIGTMLATSNSAIETLKTRA